VAELLKKKIAPLILFFGEIFSAIRFYVREAIVSLHFTKI
jgi:hypothetical protein